jgi:hypothetical protein
MPDQRSLTDQLKALIPVANQQGLYDAADYLRGVVERAEADDAAEAAFKADEDRGDHLDRKFSR